MSMRRRRSHERSAHMRPSFRLSLILAATRLPTTSRSVATEDQPVTPPPHKAITLKRQVKRLNALPRTSIW
ncbi:hypothetical protein E2C01_079396 [Portunus trituberculatus]|uniref:Uncharacterized protein n=1 Tax=Portunus trituberculatus TaxID=210409 RepID=A0A5B7IGV2_PORTR|nr:hypothetical protein [Portunus trituberculatus]